MALKSQNKSNPRSEEEGSLYRLGGGGGRGDKREYSLIGRAGHGSRSESRSDRPALVLGSVRPVARSKRPSVRPAARPTAAGSDRPSDQYRLLLHRSAPVNRAPDRPGLLALFRFLVAFRIFHDDSLFIPFISLVLLDIVSADAGLVPKYA